MTVIFGFIENTGPGGAGSAYNDPYNNTVGLGNSIDIPGVDWIDETLNQVIYLSSCIVKNIEFESAINKQLEFESSIVKQLEFDSSIVKQLEFESTIVQEILFNNELNFEFDNFLYNSIHKTC